MAKPGIFSTNLHSKMFTAKVFQAVRGNYGKFRSQFTCHKFISFSINQEKNPQGLRSCMYDSLKKCDICKKKGTLGTLAQGVFKE